ncbi:hypothetical protein IPH19_04360 [Candidatus Uhrbacteria bacterium]|jgi:hypothetical protein|nr:MAG: hypothetical protein IPH19_04360 [Candidatus Uhrbacteria bacterium]
MRLSDSYRASFEEYLKAARLDVVDPRITPEEFPNEIFTDVDMGIRIVQPSPRWFDGKTTILVDQIDAWFASSEMSHCQPAGLVEGLFLCAHSDLSFRFFEWHTVVAWGSRSRSKSLMPSFRQLTTGRAVELGMTYNPALAAHRQDRFGLDLAFLVRSRR